MDKLAELEKELLADMEENPVEYKETVNNVFKIDSNLRTINIPVTVKNIGVESDDDVKRLEFTMPKKYGEFDLSQFRIRINYMNANGDKSIYLVEDKKVSGDNITFSWLIGRDVTKYKGQVNFIVCLKLSDAKGKILKELNTTLCRLEVLEGLEVVPVIDEKTTDIIEQLLRMVETETTGVVQKVTEEGAKQIAEVQKAAQEIVADREQIQKNTESVTALKEDLIDEIDLNNYINKSTLVITGERPNILLNRGFVIDKTGNVIQHVNNYKAYAVSEPIQVEANELYKISAFMDYNKVMLAFYDISGKYVGGIADRNGGSIGTEINNQIIRIPQRVSSVRISSCRQLEFIKVEKVANSIIDKSVSLNNFDLTLQKSVESIEYENILLDFRIKNEYIECGTGLNLAYQGIDHTDYIDISSCDALNITGSSLYEASIIAFYDNAKNFILSVPSLKNTSQNFKDHRVIVPTNAKYAIFSKHSGSAPTVKKEVAYNFKTLRPLKWIDYKWCVVGDSLTEVNTRTTKHYHDYIKEKTGIKVVNMGVSGSGYKSLENNQKAFYQRISSVPADSDVVTIFGSGNDLSQELGTATDTGTATIGGCINATIDNLHKIMPTVQLGIITPTPWAGNMPSDHGTMEKYVDLINEICRNRSIPCLDLYHCSNLRPDDTEFRKLAYSKDEGSGVHPDETGHKIIASRFEHFLDSLLI